MSSAPLQLTKIEATSDLAISNSNGRVKRPKQPSEVWPSTNNAEDGPSGSTTPIALRIPTSVMKRYPVTLHITGQCTFPSEYPRAATGKLIGSLNGVDLLESEDWIIVLTPGNPPPAELKQFDLKAFTALAPFDNSVCPVPFYQRGDFLWKFKASLPIVAQDLKGDQKTRLELYWLNTNAPVGSSLIPSAVMKTGIDMQGTFPVQLLRLFVPHPTEFTGFAKFIESYDRWWAKQVISKIGAGGFIYNTISGKSAFGIGSCGGSFDMTECLRVSSFPSNTTGSFQPTLVNSFDLSALIQLGIALLLSGNGTELLDTHWVCKSPYGYLQPGMPVGLDDKSVPSVTWASGGVNNPFFDGLQPPDITTPFIAKMDLRNKDYLCNVRSWLEASFLDKNTGVLDLTSNVPPKPTAQPAPEIGMQDRASYVLAHIVVPPGTTWATENFYINNDFSTEQTGESDHKHVARVGVYDMDGVNRPRRGIVPAPFVPIPDVVRSQITSSIAAGKNPTFPSFGFNDASLKAMNIAPILLDTPPLPLVLENAPGGPSSDNVRVTDGAVMVTYNFKSMPVTASRNGRLVVKINVYDKIQNAYQAMAFELTKYERQVGQMITPLKLGPGAPSYIGHYSLQTPHSILCMRGNLFVEISVLDTVAPDRNALVLMANMMQRLDSLFASHTVQYSQVRRPSMAFVAPSPPASVKGNTTFTVKMKDVDTLANQMKVKSSKGSLVLSAGEGFSVGTLGRTFTHDFFMLDKSSGIAETVMITIAGADIDTFHPASVNFNVTVSPP